MTAPHHETPKSILLHPLSQSRVVHDKNAPAETKPPVARRSVLAARTLPLHRPAQQPQQQQTSQQHHQQHQPLILCNIRNRYASRRPCMLPPRVSSSMLLVSEDDDATSTDDDDNVSIGSCSNSSDSSSIVEEEQQQQQRTFRVRFAKSNEVFEIPNRRDYSDEDKKALFHGKKELRRMVAKNHTEHAFEGRNWRDAPEEQDFVTDAQGQSLHPVHAAKVLLQQQQAAASSSSAPSSLLPRKRRVVDRQRNNKRRRVSLETVPSAIATDAASLKDTEDEELTF